MVHTACRGWDRAGEAGCPHHPFSIGRRLLWGHDLVQRPLGPKQRGGWMPVAATPCTSAQGPAEPELEPPLHQEVSDGTGQGDTPPLPPHEAGELWA